jgi:hypothetical protein
MLKIKLLVILFFLKQFCVFSQVNCPVGEELRKVECDGEIIDKCVPQNYTCSNCWKLVFAPCPGKTGEGTNWYSTYERALQSAQNERTSWIDGECFFYDNRQFKIYLSDNKLCVSNSENAAKDDLSRRLKLLMSKFRGDLVNEIISIHAGRQNIHAKIPGGVFDEYESNIKESQKIVENLDDQMNDIADKSLSDMQDMYDAALNEQNNFNNYKNNYKTKIKGEEQKIANEKQNKMQKEVNEKYQNDLDEYNRKIKEIEQARKEAAQRRTNLYLEQAQNSNSKLQQTTNMSLALIEATGAGNSVEANRIKQEMDRQQVQNNQEMQQSLNSLGNSIMNLVEENAERRRKEAEAIEERERLEVEAEMAERKRRNDEEIAINKENERRSNIVYERKSFVESIPKGKMPNSADFISDDIYVYFISTDQITFNEFNVYVSNIVSVKKQSDNSWPLKDVVLKKHLISNNHEDIKLIGYFKNRESAEISLINISQKFKQKGADIRALVLKNISESSPLPKTEIEKNKSKSDFWNE